MLSQREIRFHKQKIIGGSFLKNVYDKVKKVFSTGSKILNRIPTGVKTEIKNLAKTQIKKLAKLPETSKIIKNLETKNYLNDRSRAILSNLIAGSGFKNYITK